MENDKKVKTFLEIEQEAEEELNQFIFIVLVPNPLTHTVRLWIDGDNNEAYMNVDRFLSIIERVCGIGERNKLAVVCTEYGTPYIYDRENKKISQLVELPNEKRIEVTPEYHKEYEGNPQGQFDVNQTFKSSKSIMEKLSNFGLPSFMPSFLKKGNGQNKK